jgi:hypothetical protein
MLRKPRGFFFFFFFFFLCVCVFERRGTLFYVFFGSLGCAWVCLVRPLVGRTALVLPHGFTGRGTAPDVSGRSE